MHPDNRQASTTDIPNCQIQQLPRPGSVTLLYQTGLGSSLNVQ